tara:strand:- start:54 stop:1217 length:1164 start_codon:yes stop_codon:yes gene_type:complete
MQWSLEDIYKKQVRGNIPRRKHLSVLGEGKSEDHNINKRNNIGYKDPKTGEWVFTRASNTYVDGIVKASLDVTESGSYLKAILKHGKKAGVLDENEDINSSKVRLIYNYLSKDVPRNQLQNIISSLPDKGLQNKFISSMNQPGAFNFYGIINSELGTQFGPNDEIVTMRPAGEEKKTRGAAGPGEALLAFLYNGKKPVVGDLDLDGTTIELKYNGGRIGKDVTTSQVKNLVKMFFNLGASGDKAGSLTQEGVSTIEDKYKDKSLADFLQDHSGVGISDVDRSHFGGINALDWFKENNKAARGTMGGSTFAKIAQIVAAIQMKAYFNKIKPFDYLGVFDGAGNIAGFNRDNLLKLNADQIIATLAEKSVFLSAKTPPDNAGFQIDLKK